MSKKYVAFISYSRKDKAVAEWLHEKLEYYILPDKGIKLQEIFPFEGKYFRPVFLDVQDLHVEERPFTERLKIGIENSAFLIVLCSRNSVVSPFVDKEIRYFLETHDNNLSRIVPLFIDEVDGSVPPVFQGTTIMQRHFPIYNTQLSKSSEANNYCLFQIVAYILKLNFSDVYNRYEVATAKALKKRRTVQVALLSMLLVFLIIVSLGAYIIIDKKQRIIDFEKKVFPAAVVHGYERNFLTPVIKHLKETPKPFAIYILMPTNSRELEHQDRVGDFLYNARLTIGIDSLPIELLDTETKRGSRIMRISKNGKVIDGIYLDFATTTTAFLDIGKFKRRYSEYKKIPLDDIINEYSCEFVRHTNRILKRDSCYVQFFFNKEDLLETLNEAILSKENAKVGDL